MNDAFRTTADQALLREFDRLLDLDEAARATELSRIATHDPRLHFRLLRMLGVASDSRSDKVIEEVVLDGLRAAQAANTSAFAPGQTLAGYRLIRELGRGGMSVVWLAERADGLIKRTVALKLPQWIVSTPEQAMRFARERDALAALTHPNIARLYDAGVADSGQPFIVLEFVEGQPLTTYCDSERLSVRERIQLFAQVLEAVGHAHRHLIVHRDLKPSNILVDATGRVKLLDFGIAKLLGDSATGEPQQDLTRGSWALTPRYAAPEQVTGAPITTQTDVYTLGLVLYEVLVGVSPYGRTGLDNTSIATVTERVLHTSIARPSASDIPSDAAVQRALASEHKLRRTLRGDLDTIVLKALRGEPHLRYASVERFARDIELYLQQRPIDARQPSLGYWMRRLLVRHKAVSMALAAGVVAASVGATVAWRQHQVTQEQTARADAVRDFMFRLINDAEPNEAQAGSDITGRQMVEAAIARARTQYSSQPRLQGELLAELGRMSARLGAHEVAAEVLPEGLALLEIHAPPDDPSLNKARTQAAGIMLAKGDVPAAVALARTAHRSCVGPGSECGKARFFAHSVLSTVADSESRPAEAIHEMRLGVAEAAQAYGADHAEVALARMSLAILLRNAGDLTEARKTLALAEDAAKSHTLRSIDRIELLRTMAVLDFDLGYYQRARERLADLVGRTRSGYERTMQYRLLGYTELALGLPIDALRSLAQGLATGSVDAEERAIIEQAQARAYSLTQKHEDAMRVAAESIRGLRAIGYAVESPDVLRARRIQAEISARRGDWLRAATELRAIVAAHASAEHTWLLEWVQALELLGCSLRELGDWQGARAAHQEALAKLSQQLPPEHPWRARNALYLARLDQQMAGVKQPSTAFIAASEQLQKVLPLESIWRVGLEPGSQQSLIF